VATRWLLDVTERPSLLHRITAAERREPQQQAFDGKRRILERAPLELEAEELVERPDAPLDREQEVEERRNRLRSVQAPFLLEAAAGVLRRPVEAVDAVVEARALSTSSSYVTRAAAGSGDRTRYRDRRRGSS
jgi:hypothetical protein